MKFSPTMFLVVVIFTTCLLVSETMSKPAPWNPETADMKAEDQESDDSNNNAELFDVDLVPNVAVQSEKTQSDNEVLPAAAVTGRQGGCKTMMGSWFC